MKLKKCFFTLAYLSVFFFLFISNSAFAKEQINEHIKVSTFPISSIDPRPEFNIEGAFYPGTRGTNQLIIYTPDYGFHTETNEFGQEATVKNNRVVAITGSNSTIPKNGFIISGHGKAKKWIENNIIVGANIKISKDKKTIESTIDPNSYLFQADQKILKVKSIIKQDSALIISSTRLDRANELALKAYNTLRKAISLSEPKKKIELAIQASQEADKALQYAILPEKREFKGIWLRPTEKNRAEISNTLDRIKEAGIDNIFLETYYQGYTIYPSKVLKSYGVREQRKEFEGFDPLREWVQLAHKKGMKLHIWFQTFYVGNEKLSGNPKHVLSVYPQWANSQRVFFDASKPMPSASEHNGYFLDPANPQVQKYLLSIIREIAHKYRPDGFNIDYIRYPASLSNKFPNYYDTTWGYTKYARQEFKEKYKIDPVVLTPDHKKWYKWNEYRQNKVTEFVSKIKDNTGLKKMTISAVIFPDPVESSIIKLQNWHEWANCRYVDAFTPLIMGSDEKIANEYTKTVKSKSGCTIEVYPGLFQPFVNGSPSDLLLQLRATRLSNGDGVILFDYAHLSDKFIEALNP